VRHRRTLIGVKAVLERSAILFQTLLQRRSESPSRFYLGSEQRLRGSCPCRCSAACFVSVLLGWPPPALRGRCALGQTRSGLGVRVARTRGSGASKAAGVLPFLRWRSGDGWGRGEAMRGLTDFDPPGC
jgi:hypothetical protein